MTRWILTAALGAAFVLPIASLQAQDTRRMSAEDLEKQKEAEAPPPKRVRNILLYNNETCPKSSDPSEIVVCANAGDSPYRIPKDFREHEVPAQNESWGRRAEVVEEVARQSRPGSCSPVGSYGQSGCTRQMMEAWAAEQRAKAADAAAVP